MPTPIGKLPPAEAKEFIASHAETAYGSTDSNGLRRIVSCSTDTAYIEQLRRELQCVSGAVLSVASPISQPAGLGDNVKKALSAVGITEERVSNWLGAPCNCAERVEKLNQLGNWASRVLSGAMNAIFPADKPRVSAETVAGCVHDGEAQAFMQFVNVPGAKLGVKPAHSSHRRILDTTGNAEALKARIIEWNKGTDRPTYDEPYVLGRWSTAVTTVPSRSSSLSETLEAIESAGFNDVELFVDSTEAIQNADLLEYNITYRRNIRTYSHWYLTLAEMYMRDPYCQWYSIFQDDLIAVRNLKQYIEQSTAGLPARHYLNLFTFMENETIAQSTTGWVPAYCNKEGRQLGRGAVGLVLPHRAATELLSNRHMIDRRQDSVRGNRSLDGAVVEAMNSAGFKEYIHCPSLLQHTGEQSSMGNPWNRPDRYPFAKTFPGKDTDALTFL